MTGMQFSHAFKLLLIRLTATAQFLCAGKTAKYVSAVALITYGGLIGSAPALRAQSSVHHTENRADQVLRGNFRVDPSTIGMSFSIPLGGYPGRAGAHVPVTLNYNSKLWRIDYDSNMPWLNQMRTWTKAKYAETSTSGWTSSLDIPFIAYTGRDQFYDTSGNGICQFCESETGWPYYIKRIHVHLSDGSAKELRTDDAAIPFDGQNPNGDFTGIFKAVDGSGMYFDSSDNTLYLPDGSRYVFSSTEVGIHGKMGRPATAFIDRNGNTISFNFQNRSWSDTMGRTLYDPIPNQAPAPGEQTYNLPGIYMGGPTNLPYKLTWANLGTVLRVVQPLAYTGDRKCSATITQWSPALFLTFDTQTFVCAKLAGGDPELFNPVVLSEVELPNGQKYQFKYNIWGEIEQVFLPTGGYERYQYSEIQALSLPDQPYKQSNRGVTSRWISVDGATELPPWQYSLVWTSPYTLRATAPDTSYTERVIIQGCTPLFPCLWGNEPVTAGMVKEERAKTPTNQMLRRSLTDWLVPSRPTKEVSIILDTGGNALAATTTYQYDADLNVISTSKHDFASVNQSSGQTGDINSIPLGTVVRTEQTTFLVNDPDIDAGTKAAYRARNLIALPTSTRVRIGSETGPIVAKSEFKYDEAAYALLPYGAVVGWNDPGPVKRGLVTTTRNWLNTNGSWLESHAQYDQCGSPRKSWDARGYLSEMEYSSAYHRAYMTQSTSPDPDGVGPVTPLVTSAIFDLTSGVPLSKTDANIKTTTFEYSALDAISNPNPLQRLTRVIQPDGGSTAYGYSDAPGNLFVVTKSALDASRNIESTQYADGLGRVWRSAKSEGATSIYGDTQYDVMGRTWKVSNPYRPEETVHWTATGYDALGRVTSVTTPDSAVVSTSYSGNQILVMDQLSAKRMSQTDALGRLTDVWEITPTDLATESISFNSVAMAGYRTKYSYDALDGLVSVTQRIGTAGTIQTRSFVYNSLKRLTSAMNPESGTISYQYDNNGNLTQKTDARIPAVTTTYIYDALNRVKNRNYSDDTPDVTYTYDASATDNFGKGRLTSVSSNVSSYSYLKYDALGRVLIGKQTTGSPDYTISYEYDHAGNMTSQTYPSGRVVRSEFDSAGRLAGVKNQATELYYAGAASDATNGFKYSAHGAIKDMKLGNGLWEHTIFNARLQPTEMRLGTAQGEIDRLKLNYDYGMTDNNGNVRTQTITVPTVAGISGFTATQTYGYDSLNRLASAQESGTSWTQNFSYDRYGNRSFISGTTLPASLTVANNPTIDPLNNRIDTAASGQTSYSYDGAGNLTHDHNVAGHTFAYDGENKQKSYDGGASAGGGASYYYDGDGRRVMKVVGGSPMNTTVFIYNIAGQLVAEYTSASPLGPGGTSYLTSDTLGSPRVITGQNQEVRARHDYLPFGEELFETQGIRTLPQGYASDSVRQKFTSKERDNETGLDYFINRYYSSTQGRFTSVDPTLMSIDPANPQTLNRYTYALNNPLAFIDPDGLEAVLVGSYNDMTEEQRRLFQTYVNGNYADQIGDMDPTAFAQRLWNESALVANTEGGDASVVGSNILTQSQLTTFLGVTNMMESRGVIGEVASITSINGDISGHEFRLIGELKNNSTSVKAMEQAFSHNIAGKGHSPYDISKREQGMLGQPNGQVTRIPNGTGVDVDVDYRALIRFSAHNTRENSDIRADDGNTSHYRRNVGRYGPIRALTPVNPTFIKQ